ncbi:MAG TPA: hypothetical protein VL981_08300 [Candidatus Methylacidiphilales bacterium]|nr:hypothetical protein [Candidatus Methylacidiphilales bacterium]
MRKTRQTQWMGRMAGVIFILSIAGCNRDETKVYHVPKDDSSPQSTPMPPPETTQPAMDASGSEAMSPPKINYQVPEGWQEKPPSEMRVASFTALGPNGESADIAVIPLPIVGRDMELINMWRSQVQLPPTSDPNAVQQAEPVTIGAEQGRLFSFVSEQPMIGKSRQRILVAMLTGSAMSWFFKMAGEDAFVASQKEKLLQFLKSVSFEEGAPAQMAGTAPAQNGNANADSGSIWTIPPGWQSMPPSQFLLAEFSVSGANGAKAEVNVAELDGEGGGVLANVNRWRGQLGLGAIGENDLPQMTQALSVPVGTATQVDFTGTDAKTGASARLIGVMVTQNGQTWFYKLMGDKDTVAQQKDVFTKFIQSANYANAR